MNACCPSRRGFAVAIVLWAVAVAALALSAVQFASMRQASAGSESIARVRATWAARAGVETIIAKLQFESKQASPLGTKSMLANLAADSEGSLSGKANFRIIHQDSLGEAPGPIDGDSKLNVNRLTQADLMLLPDMTEDLADAILDWIDADDDVRASGAELESYTGLRSPYKPRNGPIRTIRELELVRGVRPEYVRGEDWNLNGVLDANENDGDTSFPPDDADGILDAGWSQFLTADSVSGGPLTPDGEEKVNLSEAQAAQLVSLLGVDQTQADAIMQQVNNGTTDLSAFLTTPLSQVQLQQQGGFGGGGQRRATDLNDDQLNALLEKCALGDPKTLQPGKININTVSQETLEYLAILDPALRDALLLARDQASGDLLHFTELRNVPGMTNQTLAALYAVFDVRSNTFEVISRGKDETTGLEVEMICVLDRSADPVVIRSMLVR